MAVFRTVTTINIPFLCLDLYRAGLYETYLLSAPCLEGVQRSCSETSINLSSDGGLFRLSLNPTTCSCVTEICNMSSQTLPLLITSSNWRGSYTNYKECLDTLHGILCSVSLCGNHNGWSFALNSVQAHSQAHTTANSPLVIG